MLIKYWSYILGQSIREVLAEAPFGSPLKLFFYALTIIGGIIALRVFNAAFPFAALITVTLAACVFCSAIIWKCFVIPARRFAASEELITELRLELASLKSTNANEPSAEASALRQQVRDLEARIATLRPRRLTAEQRQTIIQLASPLKPRKLIVIQEAECPDADRFARDISDAFRSAAWPSEVHSYQGGIPASSAKGLVITAGDEPEPSHGDLTSILRGAGLDFDVIPGSETGIVVCYVGD